MFRVRYSSPSHVSGGKEAEGIVVKATQPPQQRLLPLNLTPYAPTADPLESSSSSDSEDDLSPLTVTVEKPGSLARRDWEKFQLKVSKQLLARYFYSCECTVYMICVYMYVCVCQQMTSVYVYRALSLPTYAESEEVSSTHGQH